MLLDSVEYKAKAKREMENGGGVFKIRYFFPKFSFLLYLFFLFLSFLSSFPEPY